jgi:predicted DNA-binding transcriptional regulator YafY
MRPSDEASYRAQMTALCHICLVKKKSRLFALTEHLRGRRSGVTAEELAERFGVSVRTIFRDLDALRDAQLPLRADRGRGGGVALDKSYSLPPVNFSAREAAVLLTLTRMAKQLRLLPLQQTLAGAEDKVRAALSSSAQHDLLEHMQSIQFVGVPSAPVREAVRTAIERAWLERTACVVAYDGKDGTTTRTIRIRSMVIERGSVLLNCDDLDKGASRQFVLDRIVDARVI